MYRIEYKDRMLGWVTIAAGPENVLMIHYGKHLTEHPGSYKIAKTGR